MSASSENTPATEPAIQEPDVATEAEPQDNGNAEAARYRRRLRDTEAELKAADARVEAAQRALVEQVAEQERIRPAALWASGVTLPDLLDEDGNVDRTKIADAANKATAELGLSRTPKPDPTQGSMAGHTWPPQETFQSAFTPKF